MKAGWKLKTTGKDARGFVFFVWEGEDEKGPIYRVANNANPPWSDWSMREYLATAYRLGITLDNGEAYKPKEKK